MAYNSEDRAARYRARAGELRILAAYLKHPAMRAELIGLADGYDRMADGVQQSVLNELPDLDPPEHDH